MFMSCALHDVSSGTRWALAAHFQLDFAVVLGQRECHALTGFQRIGIKFLLVLRKRDLEPPARFMHGPAHKLDEVGTVLDNQQRRAFS